MKAIRLYQIPFSHFCDKVRWSLDFYSIPYKSINFVHRRTPGLEKAPRKLQRLTPIIEDPNNESLFISDSTPILRYLDNQYGTKEKTLFPGDKDVIEQYCLKLDSELGLYTRRLAYLYIISEHPAILSVFVDGKLDKVSCDDWKSYFRGILGSCFLIARQGIDRIREENIFEKTVFSLEEIKKNLDGKEYLFNNQFTAADLTLISLIQPLRLVTPLFIKYKSIFEHCDQIRERHDPKKWEISNIERFMNRQREKKQGQSIIRNTFHTLFYPLQFLFAAGDKEKPLLQYPSSNANEKAHNDARVLKLDSKMKFSKFFLKYFWHFCFTVPKQMEYVKNQGNQILNKHHPK